MTQAQLCGTPGLKTLTWPRPSRVDTTVQVAFSDALVATADRATEPTVAPSILRSAHARDLERLAHSTHVLSLPSRLAKRGLDVLGASTLLLLFAPLLVIAGLAVVLTSRGPAVFAQERIGRGGRPFRMYKLRSMRTDGDDAMHRAYVARLIKGDAATENGIFKLVQDPRITRAGRALRRYSIDELPQLWNILRGDMSLVGPRPALAHEVELYDDTARQRLAVQPGLTGLWQVSGRCRLSFADMIALDVTYWRRWSLLLDLQILIRTPFVALSGRGAA